MLRSGDVGVIYKWNPRNDTFPQIGDMTRLADTLMLYSGYSSKEIDDDIVEKAKVLNWMVKHDVLSVNDAGLVVANYYRNKSRILDMVNNDVQFSKDIF